MQKNGKTESTIYTAIQKLSTLATRCNILEPEQVKSYLATSQQKNSSKQNIASLYTTFLQYKGLKWQPPHYTIESSIPFIPMEKEIDEMIAGMSKTISTFLQLMKETGARGIEAHRTQWIDVDPERRTIYIRAAKGSNSRILPISPKLLGMINSLPKTTPTLFNGKLKRMRANFNRQRKALAEKMNNPRLAQIHFHTMRHWKGTIEYHKTKDIIHVKTVLGHKDIESTMIYINIEQALFLEESDEFTCKVATTPEQAIILIEAGFQYVTDIDNKKLFRKRK